MKQQTSKRIYRTYVFSTRELRKALGLEGELTSMGLSSGRSPNEVEKGKSPETDTWYFTTEEKDEVKK